MNFKDQVTDFCVKMAAHVKAQQTINENLITSVKALSESLQIAQERITILAEKRQTILDGYYGPG